LKALGEKTLWGKPSREIQRKKRRKEIQKVNTDLRRVEWRAKESRKRQENEIEPRRVKREGFGSLAGMVASFIRKTENKAYTAQSNLPGSRRDEEGGGSSWGRRLEMQGSVLLRRPGYE